MLKSGVYPVLRPPPAWRWMGERGLRVETGAATLAYYESLVSQKLDEIEDVIPADGSVLVILRHGGGVSAGITSSISSNFCETSDS